MIDTKPCGHAILSPCGTYRYRLEREITATGIVVCYVGVNPSTADAKTDDATVRKWRGFSKGIYASRFIVGNLFGLRTTDVRGLAIADDPIGPGNDAELVSMFAHADVIVPCWGSRSKLPQRLHKRIATVVDLLRCCGRPVRVFGLTASRDPMHPLMLGYSTQLVDWAV